ncbi:MAG TPA: FtsX-like permease family protein [Jatrophihabitans sp.]|nr:FtsX-like permease family protein [Jatrophihabitans sp.]
MTPAVRLGLRLVRGNDLVLRLRSILAALGAAICVLLLLGVLAAWHVGRVAEARNVAQAPHPDDHGALLYYQVADRWHGKELTRVYLATNGQDAPVPPGLSRLPAAGEVVLSPNLAAALAGGDPELRARFGGLRVSIIGRAGLTSQSQQLAYLAASATQLAGGQSVSSFGDPLQVTRTTARLKLLSLLLFIVFVGVPYAGMCAVATRLGAAARRRRLAALWMIGVPPRQLRLAAAVEAAVAVFVGAALGVGSYQALRSVLAAHTTINGIRPFAADLGLPILSQLAVLVAVVLVAIVSGTLLSGSAGWRGTRPIRTPHRFGAIPLLVLGLGAVLALATAWVVSTDPRSLLGVLLLDATAAALVVGASLSLATLVQRAGGLIARALPSGSTLLAARRLESDPGAMARLGAMVLPAIFTIGFAATLASQFQLSDSSAANQANFHGRQAGIVQAPPLPGATLDPSGITALVALPHTRTSGNLDVLVASCPQLRQLSGQPSLQCPVGHFVLDLVNPFAEGQTVAPTPVGPQQPESNSVVFTSLSGKTVTVPMPSTSLRVEVATPFFAESRALVLPPDDLMLADLGPLPVWELTVAVPAGDDAAVGALRASVAVHNPLAEVDLAGEDELTANAGYARYGNLVLLLALVASAVGAAGVVITALDAVLTRRRQLEPLLVLGVSRAALRRATAAEITAPLVLAVLIGAGIAAICGSLFAHRNSSAHLALPVLGLSAAAGVGIAVVVAAIAVTLVPSTPNRVSSRPD